MSQLEILAGRINTLLDGLWLLVCAVGVVYGLVCALMAIITFICGDWRIRLGWLALLGCFWGASVLAPLMPYGNVILPPLVMVLGGSVAFWFARYR